MTDSAELDPQALRRALGSFVSGITVITCAAPDDEPVGVTVSSFCSLSLSPPMVLWCIDRGAHSHVAFLEAPRFAAHVLAQDQWPVAERFATRGADKFGLADWEPGHDGTPLLAGCAARFECLRKDVHEGGDHLIITGEIENFAVTDNPPLAYHQGRFALTHRGEEAARLMGWEVW